MSGGSGLACIYCEQEVENEADMFCPDCMQFECSDVVDEGPAAATCEHCGAEIADDEEACYDCAAFYF